MMLILRFTAPEYNKDYPPNLLPSGNVIIVDWTKSFFINGEVQYFILFVDHEERYRGPKTAQNIFRESVYKSK